MLSITEGLIVNGNIVPHKLKLAHYGYDKVRFLAPVHPGDTVHVQCEVKDVRGKNDTFGIVTFEYRVLNQRDELVLIVNDLQMVELREAPDMDELSSGPLDGIRVLDFSMAMAGPFAAVKLADLGANVVKVEPTTGEWQRTRAAGNAWLKTHNASFFALNRNKRSVAIDLKAERGHVAAERLIDQADVVIINYRSGTAERLGLGWETVHARNSRVVYCSLTGYGETGPYARRPGQDLLLQGYSGAMWNTGVEGDPPQPVPIFAMDATAANVAVQGILAALIARERIGRGQKVEVNMLDSALDLQVQEFGVYLASGVKPIRTTRPLAHGLIPAPYGVYRTKDGWMTIAFGAIDELGRVIGDDRLASFTEWNDGFVHRDEIFDRLTELTPTKTSAEWLEIFDEIGFWAGPVLDYDQVAADPQVNHNGMVIEVDHPTEGRRRMLGIPIRYSETPGSVRHPTPLIGEQSTEILAEAGFSEDEVAELIHTGVVAQEQSAPTPEGDPQKAAP